MQDFVQPLCERGQQYILRDLSTWGENTQNIVILKVGDVCWKENPWQHIQQCQCFISHLGRGGMSFLEVSQMTQILNVA